jgi:hypothetical protein
MGKQRVLTGVRVASIVVVIAAIVYQMVVSTSAGRFGATRFFAYFTIQSNLIGVAAFGWVVLNGSKPRSHALESFRGASTGYLTVTFTVVILLLSSADVGLAVNWVDLVLHKLFPVIVVLDWLIDPPTVRLGVRDALAWLIYPFIWLPLTLIRGAIDGWYPYPFLDPVNGGYGFVAITIVGITIGFLVVAAIYIWIGNWRRATAEAQPV